MFILIACIFIAADQLSKLAAVKYLKGSTSRSIIGNFFQLSYVENRGAAFGILQDKKVFFVIVSLAVISILLWLMIKEASSMSFIGKISLVMLLSGTIGNFIDRIKQGYVVDFISFNFGSYSFPVFNIADICIVIGTILLMLIIIFEKENL